LNNIRFALYSAVFPPPPLPFLVPRKLGKN
jgi:hypothetical protein